MIGDQIKAARKKYGMTQVELGNKIGVKGATVTRYEKGVIIPNFDTLKKIANALSIDITELLSDEQLDSRRLNAANYGLLAVLETVYDSVNLKWDQEYDYDGVPVEPNGEFTVTLVKGTEKIHLTKQTWETLFVFVRNNLPTFVEMARQEPPEK